MPRWLYFLLIFAVLAPILDFLHAPQAVLFIVAALGIIPLAALIGQAVEEVAEHTGERIGGLLFATFGNATELIISIFALAEGLVDVVRASLIGTILGNALLVLGVSVCVGCFKHGRLKFETRPASQYASLFALCIGGLVLPTIAELHVANMPQVAQAEHNLSDFIAVLLLCGYLASILFSVFRIGDKGDAEEELEPLVGIRSIAAIDRLLAYRHHLVQNDVPGKSGILPHIDNTVQAIMSHQATQQGDAAKEVASSGAAAKSETQEAKASEHHPIVASLTPAAQHAPKHAHKPPLWRGLLLLTIATVGVAILSEILVGSIEPMAKTLGWNEAFVGLIFVPLIGGLPEYFNTISMALDKRIGMVLAASAGSSIQIALLVAPILVLVSLFTPERLDLVFSIVELAVLGIATFLFSEITKDGELVWLEGLLLILLYGMMGSTVFLFGA
jgi:Ca2+:H+ antiporter